ncbi:MAG: hypothetical protein ABFQ95_04075 [Pseudomonadota bacterium]
MQNFDGEVVTLHIADNGRWIAHFVGDLKMSFYGDTPNEAYDKLMAACKSEQATYDKKTTNADQKKPLILIEREYASQWQSKKK